MAMGMDPDFALKMQALKREQAITLIVAMGEPLDPNRDSGIQQNERIIKLLSAILERLP